jgi:hypothetical protein
MSPVLSKAATSFEADAGWIKSNDRGCMARNLSRWNLIVCSAKNYMGDRIDEDFFALIWKGWKSRRLRRVFHSGVFGPPFCPCETALQME